MFVVIINFPPIKAGKDAAFCEWFAETKSGQIEPNIAVKAGE